MIGVIMRVEVIDQSLQAGRINLNDKHRFSFLPFFVICQIFGVAGAVFVECKVTWLATLEARILNFATRKAKRLMQVDRARNLSGQHCVDKLVARRVLLPFV